jgi:hypothetical protein
MFNSDDTFEKLKEVFEGKTVVAVEPGDAAESICRFVLSDGKAWRLHATDLGYWLEETAGFEGYTKLTNLARDYHHHVYWLAAKYDYDVPDAKVEVKDTEIIITSPTEKVFTISRSKCSENEMKILTHPIGAKIFGKAVGELGDAWVLDFRNNEDCPEELRGLV